MTEAAAIETKPRARRTPMTAAAAPEPEPAPVVQTAAPANRRVRVPFGTKQQRLDNTPIPGFQCYWVNDVPGRVDKAKRAGYEHVTDDQGNPVVEIVGVAPAGGPLKAYRMKLPVEFYLEDMEAKEAPRAQLDQDMRQSIKDKGYSSPTRPGFQAESAVAANLDPTTGRQKFNLPSPGNQSQS